MSPGRSRSILASILFSLLLLLISLTTLTLPPEKWAVPSIPRPQLCSSTKDIRSDLAHAEHLWTQSVKDRKQMAIGSGNARFPDGFIYPYNVWDFVRPAFYCPYDLERVGKLGDGGKWVCGMGRYEAVAAPVATGARGRPLVVYSFGVSDDSSFEAALLRRTNAEIWGYDFSVQGWAKDVSVEEQGRRAHFEKWKLGAKTDEKASPQVWAVKDLMDRNGHIFIDVMKIDVEGAEFGVLDALMEAVEAAAGDELPVLPVGQMLIEIHLLGGGGPKTPGSLQEFLKWWERLEALAMRPVFNEHNWIGDAGPGKPRFIEYTLINVRNEKNRLL
ncbi:methyltransferase domain-containing protein 16 [Elsinoe australis]|uniref:Methyltransferase domain-containing protein 16 n=1 Tax=Elsinoe australis TaxID=40998 RepID=A0A4U7AZ64_9PEZI|nr:methyltransferase domain-containing protein 16 [Elsinoe australis]